MATLTLKDLRARAGLTQAQLATALGVSGPAQVSEWEVGRSRPSLKHLTPLARVLCVDVGELVRAVEAIPAHDGSDHRKVPDRERRAVRRRDAKSPAQPPSGE